MWKRFINLNSAMYDKLYPVIENSWINYSNSAISEQSAQSLLDYFKEILIPISTFQFLYLIKITIKNNKKHTISYLYNDNYS